MTCSKAACSSPLHFPSTVRCWPSRRGSAVAAADVGAPGTVVLAAPPPLSPPLSSPLQAASTPSNVNSTMGTARRRPLRILIGRLLPVSLLPEPDGLLEPDGLPQAVGPGGPSRPGGRSSNPSTDRRSGIGRRRPTIAQRHPLRSCCAG